MILVTILIVTALYLFYKYWVSSYKYWDERGIPCIPGKFPYGSDYYMTTMKKFQGIVLDEMCRQFPSNPYFGIYVVRQPFLIARDPEMIQLVLVKEFSSFKDRLIVKIPESDKLSHHLINLDGERWRALRIKLSPTFTSGRMKAMFPLFLKCSEAYTSLLQTHSDSVIDVKNLASRYTIDIICNCAFGLETNNIEDENSDFMKIGKNVLSFNFSLMLGFILCATFPEFVPYLPIRLSPENKESQKYVYKVVKQTIKYREENNIRRNDFLDLLIQLKNKGSLEDDRRDETEENIPPFEMTMERVAAQCFVFFVAGFETSSSVQTFCLYELALNKDIQKRLQKEIDESAQKHAGITYEGVNEMTYLDMVVSETLRKYPTFPGSTRVCTKNVTLPNGDIIEKGVTVFLPFWALHRDPRYFPEPEKFDPERFSPENKTSINPYAYIPFGEGPRICIGKRFGLLQTKMGLITVLRKYNVEPFELTNAPLELFGNPATTPVKPIKVKLVPRLL